MNAVLQTLSLAFFLLFFLLFISLPFLVVGILFWISGWPGLAERFRYRGRFEGKHWRFQTLSVGQVVFRNSMLIGINDEGFYLAPFFFRSFFNPLLIPWEEIQIREFQWKLFRIFPRNGCEMEIRSLPNIDISFGTPTFEKIIEDVRARVEPSPADETKPIPVT